MAHFGRVGIVLSPRLNNNGCHDWHNAHPRKTLNCKLVKRSRELLNWSRCVSWFIAPADQILQWTWKKKMSRIGSSFRALRKLDPPLQIHMVPPFVDENSPTFHLQIHGEEVYRCREICGKPATVFDFKWVSSRLVTSSRSLLEIVLGAQSRKAFGDFKRKIQATADGKRRKKLEPRLGLNCLIYRFSQG